VLVDRRLRVAAESLEPASRELSAVDRILNVLVAHVEFDGAGVMRIVGLPTAVRNVCAPAHLLVWAVKIEP
jgi:hypothetical protein